MRLKTIFTILFSLLTAITLLACGSGGGSGVGDGLGKVSFALTDSATDQYRGVYITISDLQICSVSSEQKDKECNWMSIEAPEEKPFPQTYNLLKLVNGITESIGSGEFSVGEYQQVRLIIGLQPEFETNLLGEYHPAANYLILNDGNDTVVPLKIPSGPQTGIKLIHPFTVDEGIKELVLDFDACKSVVKAGNSGKYILKPTIKVIEPIDKIDIEGTVEDGSEALIEGAMVSAQISDGLSTTVVRSTVTDGEGTEGDNLEIGEFRLSLLSPNQIYNVVAYSSGNYPECVAFRYNDPNLEFPDLPLNFQLEAILTEDFVLVSGEVTVDGDEEEDFPLVITVYTKLECNHPDGEGYVELTQISEISYEVDKQVFKYEIELPTYEGPVIYYFVASADGYYPDTGTAVALSGDTEVSVAPLTIRPVE